MAVKPIPDGYHTVTPYLLVRGVRELIEFTKKAFGASEVRRMGPPDGPVMHAEIKIGDSRIMMGEASGEWQPMPASLYLYVEDCDSMYRSAIAAGGTSINEPRDEFYGDRMGGVKDPSGNTWWIATHKEDMSEAEMARRSAEAMKKRK